jgi:hypothetical protein
VGLTSKRFSTVPHYICFVKTKGFNLICKGDVTFMMRNLGMKP